MQNDDLGVPYVQLRVPRVVNVLKFPMSFFLHSKQQKTGQDIKRPKKDIRKTPTGMRVQKAVLFILFLTEFNTSSK